MQEFSEILDATVKSIPVNCEKKEVTDTFNYFGSMIHSSTICDVGVRGAWDEHGSR